MNETDLEIKYVDLEKNMVAQLKGKDFADHLEKIKKAVNIMLQKMEKIGAYEKGVHGCCGYRSGYSGFQGKGRNCYDVEENRELR